MNAQPWYQGAAPIPPDPILGLGGKFKSDTRPVVAPQEDGSLPQIGQGKINLAVGVYMRRGAPVVFEAVKDAVVRAAQELEHFGYADQTGVKPFVDAVKTHVFGKDHPALTQGLLVTRQTIGGTGAYRAGASLVANLKGWVEPDRENGEVAGHLDTSRLPVAYVDRHTWPAHLTILSQAGFRTKFYPFHDVRTRTADFDATIEFVRGEMPEGSLMSIQLGPHNSTGNYWPMDKLRELIAACRDKRITLLSDFAYDSFGKGHTRDCEAVRLLAHPSDGLPGAIVAYSCAKAFGTYGLRVGALFIVGKTKADADTVLSSRANDTLRGLWSTPEIIGGNAVALVINDAKLWDRYEPDIEGAREHTALMRRLLVEELLTRHGVDWRFLVQQEGMFSFPGFTDQQSEKLWSECGILTAFGRLNFASTERFQIPYIADSIAYVLSKYPESADA